MVPQTTLRGAGDSDDSQGGGDSIGEIVRSSGIPFLQRGHDVKIPANLPQGFGGAIRSTISDKQYPIWQETPVVFAGPQTPPSLRIFIPRHGLE